MGDPGHAGNTVSWLGAVAARLRRRFALAREARLIRESGLFDEEYYLRRYPDVAESGESALQHYLRHGAREGRNPSVYFETVYYVRQRREVLEQSKANPLIDFLDAGAAAGANPNPLFDSSFYRATHSAVFPENVNPLLHYLRRGWREGLDPSPLFTVRQYLNANPDVRNAGLEPLGHFLAFGLAEGRGDRPEGGVPLRPGIAPVRGKAPPMKAPPAAEWDVLAARWGDRPTADRPLVDVIVPVYLGRDETLACIYSAIASSSRVPHRIVVIDDASPDADLSRELMRLRDLGLIDLLVNESNLGFVRTCNRGMSLHPDRDVVLLNSDAEVYGDWLDRLYRAARSRPWVATVTPFSNNAEICSYPTAVFNNDYELELSYADLDAVAARVNAGCTVEVPTGVGFCLYLRRDCLREVGAFDEERFGRGYGEENDFCLRAEVGGWVNLLACDVFVRHAGGVSFGPEKVERSRRAQALLRERFPDYARRIQEFVSRDPARKFRSAIDLERLRLRLARPAFALVTHNLGGGTERHVRELSRALESEGIGVVQIRPDRLAQRQVWLVHPDVGPLPNLGPFDIGRDPGPLAAALERVGVAHLHVHHLLGTDVGNVDWVAILAAKMGVRYDVTAHDYFPICPRVTLVGGNGRYCNEPEPARCDECLRANGSPVGAVAIGEWRTRFGRLLGGARAVFAPGKDALERYRKYFPEARLLLRPHAEPPVQRFEQPTAARKGGEPLRVAIIGALVQHKGFQKVRDLAEDASSRQLPIEFIVHGYSEDDQGLLRTGKVKITGPYEDGDLPRLLQDSRCHCALFPAVWPETYSYTLSHALRSGLYPVVTDLGAPAERVRDLGWGTVVAHDIGAQSMNDALLALSIAPPPDPSALGFASYASYLKDYYQYQPPAAETGTDAPASPAGRALAPARGGSPRVSVVMATYNGNTFLREQLESLSRQEWRPHELVVCDDASTDQTWAMLSAFRREAPFEVRTFRNKPNLGSTRAFEKAIRLARGDVIALCDQDDLWAPDKLAILIDKLARPGVSVAFTDGLLVGPRLESLGGTLWESVGFKRWMMGLLDREGAPERLLRQNVVTGCASAFWARYRPFLLPISPYWVHDYWLAVILSLVGDLAPIAVSPLVYRQHGGNQIGAMPRSDSTAPDWLGSVASAPPTHFSLSRRALTDLSAHLAQLVAQAERLSLDQQAVARVQRLTAILQTQALRRAVADMAS